MATRKQIRYSDAGVSIEEADRAVDSIRRLARKTFTPGVLTDIGTFGAAYQLKGWKQPVLVSSADGVGTKLKLAFMTGRHGTVGEDLVNHCVNDVAVQGAVPLFFLDYFAVGKLQAPVAAQVVEGLARGCQRNGCALIGGETAEMPGLYFPGEYDLAGFIVGVAERKNLLTGAKIREGDIVIGLRSNGLHTNGYSLARKLLFETAGFEAETVLPEIGVPLAEELLKVHASYLAPIRSLLEAGLLHGAAHITGGGITDNIPRILPKGMAVFIDTQSWRIPPIFELLRSIGNIPDDDYRRTFNLGIGMILVVPENRAPRAGQMLKKMGADYCEIGRVTAQRRGRPRVEYQ